MKRIPVGVLEILEIAKSVYTDQNRLWMDDVESATKLWVEITGEAVRIAESEEIRRRFIRGIITWVVFQKNISFKRVFNKVFDYLAIFELDVYKDRYVKDFVIAYEEYAAKRWGDKVNVGVSINVITAAKVARKLLKEFKLTMMHYIKIQHECWDKITWSLSMSALSDENRCRRRYQIFQDMSKQKGVLQRTDYTEGVVRRKWNEILQFGVEKFLEKTQSKGYLVYIAKMFVEDKKRGVSQQVLESRYSPEIVEENYRKLDGEISYE